MPIQSYEILSGIREKIEELKSQRDEALNRIKALRSEIDDLKAELDDTRKSLHQSRLDAEFLTLSHKMADTPEALVKSRKLIADLIRKVDSVINLVQNDPAEL